MVFEWDENQCAANLDKHGLDLIEATALFDGRRVVTYRSTDNEELRLVTIGVVAKVFVVVVWTPRGEDTRLISFRRASRGEREVHHARFR